MGTWLNDERISKNQRNFKVSRLNLKYYNERQGAKFDRNIKKSKWEGTR